eukprot:6491298-Amphidinium_carterae.1
MNSVAPPPRNEEGLKAVPSRSSACFSCWNLTMNIFMPPGSKGVFGESCPNTAKAIRRTPKSSMTTDCKRLDLSDVFERGIHSTPDVMSPLKSQGNTKCNLSALAISLGRNIKW